MVIVAFAYSCTTCGHAVNVGINPYAPLCVGNQCPKCFNLYTQDFSDKVIAEMKKYFSGVIG